MRLKLLLPLIVTAILGQACLELPAIDNSSDAGRSNPGNDNDAGITPQKYPPEVMETHQTANSTPGGGVITLSIGARDPQNSSFGFSWEASAGSLSAQSSTTTSSEVVWTAPTCGASPSETAATIKATVTNTLGLSTTKDFSVKGTCYAPEIVETQQSATSTSGATPVTLGLTARDPQNSSLTFSWRSTEGSISNLNGSATTNEVVWTPPACGSPPTNTMATITATVTNALRISTVTSISITATCPKWLPTQTMNTVRFDHTATLLPSGKVLVTGGQNGSKIATAELYDPANRTWTTTENMAFARAYHTATLLPSGKVLVTGGKSDSTSATAELYDPATGTWTQTSSMSYARAWHTATLLNSGKVLVAGGYNESDSAGATAELYDPATGTWSPTGNMVSTHNNHTATLLPSGKVLVIVTNRSELYDPSTGTWSRTPTQMAFSRINHTATLLPSGKVLVTGGNNGSNLSTSELYDPTTGIWNSTGSMASARVYHQATLLPSGKVLVTGGYPNSTYSGEITTAELYDPTTGTWASTVSMLAARAHHTATLLSSAQVLISGYGSNPMAELYEP